MKRIIIFLLGVVLTFSAFSLTGCKDKGDGLTESEKSWSDENVDNNGWT